MGGADPSTAEWVVIAYTLPEDAPIESLEGLHPLSMYRSYPNPFKSFITLKYQLFRPAKVEIVIYNTLGQRVKTTVKGYQKSGDYNSLWGGEDNLGKKLSPGVYFCVLKVDNYTKIEKVILIR